MNEVAAIDSFNLTEDFKPDPLCPPGKYMGSVTSLKMAEDNKCLIMGLTLMGNAGFMTDNATPIDGTTYFYRVWFPLDGDRNVASKSVGKSKFDTKVSMLGTFAKKVVKDEALNGFGDFETAVSEQRYMGRNFTVTIKIGDEWQGSIRNEVERLTPAS